MKINEQPISIDERPAKTPKPAMKQTPSRGGLIDARSRMSKTDRTEYGRGAGGRWQSAEGRKQVVGNFIGTIPLGSNTKCADYTYFEKHNTRDFQHNIYRFRAAPFHFTSSLPYPVSARTFSRSHVKRCMSPREKLRYIRER